MSKVHSVLVSYILTKMSEENDPKISKLLDGKSEEQSIRLMFLNVRINEAHIRGLRLTNFGATIMRNYFQVYEIFREGKKLTPYEMVFLDRTAKLPYWFDDSGDILMFDPELGLKLKLTDGDIAYLIETATALS